jgi:hypothetical protein
MVRISVQSSFVGVKRRQDLTAILMTLVHQVARNWRGEGQEAMIPIVNVGYA